MTTITFQVEVRLPSGAKTIDMVEKRRSEIEDCDEGKIILLYLVNGDQVTGFFKGMSGDDVKVGSLSGNHCLGYNISWIKNYLEEVSTQQSSN